MLGCDQAKEKDLVLGCDVTLNCQLEMEEQENYHWETHTYAIRWVLSWLGFSNS